MLKKLEGKSGYVKYKQLEKAGIKCTALGITMSKDDMERFSDYCKREKILFTATINVDDKDKKTKVYNILCPESEKENILNIVKRMNDEKMVEAIDKKIEEIKSKGVLTKYDKFAIDKLMKEREKILRNYCELLNEKQAAKIFKEVFKEDYEKYKDKEVSFDRALDRYTGGILDRNQVTIICDAQDPSKYIKCFGYNDTFNGKTYVKTEYEVYNGDKVVYKTHDGRFEGRPAGYWENEKKAIKEFGGFSESVLKFYSVKEYEKWAQKVMEQNKDELDHLKYDGSADRNYDEICSKLEEDLNKNGALYKDGRAVDSKTEEPLKVNSDMTKEEKIIIAESLLIAEQINTYKALKDIETELAIANASVITSREGTQEHAEALAHYNEICKRYDEARAKEYDLIEMRKQINSIRGEHEVRKEFEREDSRRTERVDELETKEKTMASYRGKIVNLRQKAKPMSNDFVDRQFQKAQKMVEKKTAMNR